MDKNIVEFSEYNIKMDLREIENMNREQLKKCKNKIQEIKEILKKK